MAATGSPVQPGCSLDGGPAADLPPAGAALTAGFTAMTARWSAGDEDGE